MRTSLPRGGSRCAGGRGVRRAVLLAGLCVIATMVRSAPAQTLPPGQTAPAPSQPSAGALTIDEVLAGTLRVNQQIRTARAEVELQRGTLVQSARPFDTRPIASVGGERIETGTGLDVTTAPQTLATLGSSARLDLIKTFRNGLTLGGDVELLRASRRDPTPATLNQFIANVGLTVPLLQRRGGGLEAAVERAASADYRATIHTLRLTAGSAVLDATRAYWDYRAAYERAAIQRAAAARALRIVDEVKILIAADERPRSDVDLMVANAATKHVSELQADRAIVQARLALALAMGLDTVEAAALADPGTAFPDRAPPEPPPLDSLIADALKRQDQLAAAAARKDSAALVSDGARNQARTRLDLVLGAGYTGETRGGSLGRTFGALWGDVLGPNVSARLVLEPSRINSALRGALIQSRALESRAIVISEQLTRAITLAVADARSELMTTREQLASTREAVDRSRLALETVQRNFELGTATLFDRILAEDTVTNAEIAALAASQRYAVALAALQFARGVLIGGTGPDLQIDPARVLRALPEDAQ